MGSDISIAISWDEHWGWIVSGPEEILPGKLIFSHLGSAQKKQKALLLEARVKATARKQNLGQ